MLKDSLEGLRDIMNSGIPTDSVIPIKKKVDFVEYMSVFLTFLFMSVLENSSFLCY